jgi:2-iminobutanoate/2-iminopropanoate deaminase
MARQAGVTSRAPHPVGPYSQSARIGRLVHAAGQGANDPSTGELAGSDIETQTRQCLPNVQAVLAVCGVSLDDVLRVGVFFVDAAQRRTILLTPLRPHLSESEPHVGDHPAP